MARADGSSADGSPAAAASAARPVGAALVLLALLFAALNLLVDSTLTGQRIDLTEDRLYTLSPGTRQVLSGIEEPVTLRYYYSSALGREVPHYGVYAGRVRDLLDEYVNQADGRLRLEVYDPEPFSDVEDRAVSFGLQQVPLNASQRNVFFGIVGTNTTDDVETQAFLQPEREAFLEYELTRMIDQLSAPRRTVVGIISTLAIHGEQRLDQYGRPQQTPPYILTEQIVTQYETEFLGKVVDRVPENVTVLLIVHPKGLDTQTQYAIDQFILAGGKALILVDPFSETEGSTGQMVGTFAVEGSTLDPMFAAWGLKMDTGKVVGDRLTARKVSPGPGERLVDYVPWLSLRGPNLDRASPVTRGIDSVAVASAGALELAEGAAVTLSPLLTSSPGSMLIDQKKVQGFRNPRRLLNEYRPSGKTYVIAARVNGQVPSAWPDGPPQPEEPAETEGEGEGDAAAETPPPPTRPAPDPALHLAASKGPIDVILVADSDLLADRFWVVVQDFFGRRVPAPSAGNGDFVLNALDALAGGGALTDLRGRGSSARPFDLIRRIERDANQKFEAKERQLTRTLDETEAKLRELRQRNPEGGAALISDRDRRLMERYQREILGLRAELRAVQRSLNEDIKRLQTRLWFVNIALVPIFVAVLAVGLWVLRIRRRRDRAHEAAAA